MNTSLLKGGAGVISSLLASLPLLAQTPGILSTSIPTASALPEGYTLKEGDILVRTNRNAGFEPAAFVRYSAQTWPDGIVYYIFDENVSAANQAKARAAMALWEAVADVHFTVGYGGSPGNFYYIRIKDSDCNASEVGRQLGGFGQILMVTSWNSLDVTHIIAHELGHALGFWHQQSRTDRNSYIQINWDNIEDGKGHNFEIADASRHYGPYDFDSVMHYKQYAFSANGLATITVLPPNDVLWQNAIGQLSHLSDWDKRIMSFLYPDDNWRFADHSNSSSGSGTFLDPYRLLSSAVSSVPSGGTIWLEPGIYPGVGTYSKPMTWNTALGGVMIGN